jgi:hypothetical protein
MINHSSILDLVPLGFGRVKNGPALAGHGAEAVRDAIRLSRLGWPRRMNNPFVNFNSSPESSVCS